MVPEPPRPTMTRCPRGTVDPLDPSIDGRPQPAQRVGPLANVFDRHPIRRSAPTYPKICGRHPNC
jgi:hypothetical protein